MSGNYEKEFCFKCSLYGKEFEGYDVADFRDCVECLTYLRKGMALVTTIEKYKRAL